MEERIVKLYPLRKLGIPEDVAKVVTFLASDGASHVTGQTLSVSGGYSMV
jgi:NAD(P)-dependent dehydrogenase (short-subunit alcohol dehydrogenase family)